MRSKAVTLFAFLAVAISACACLPEALADGATTDGVVVMYFHRTNRCPTCLKMGGYSEEAVAKGFAQEIKSGKVAFHYIDFQNEKNAALTAGYKVSGPTLIVARISGDKVAEYKNLADIWAKVRDKAEFVEYVQSNVKNYAK
jgi:hypothetical protein